MKTHHSIILASAVVLSLPFNVKAGQAQVMGVNQNIERLVSDQQIATRMISALQVSLNAAHQEISSLKSKNDQIGETTTRIHRTANGHGR